ncbi:hypothetical protein F4778DRAFT_774200 [Xylariomycetidae sp. FL2044]|nr:hypothetical protein F4778DRAFT_774200 [Xylariomycetidae sp. FL2044]
MLAVPHTVMPRVVRFGSVLLAAFLVYYVIREPVNVAFDKLTVSIYAGGGSLRAPDPNDKDVKPPALIDLDGESPAIQDQNGQTPLGDSGNDGASYVKIYKPEPEPYDPVGDHFPWLTYNRAPPPVLENNLPPNPHVEEPTPLLIGFTRGWPLLLQCVSSYIAAGWPPEDIYVVENTGTFGANGKGELTLQNPFFLNHTALRMLGVNVVTTPALLTFAQLQNFFLSTALQRDWPHFFWSHQDVLVLSDEDVRRKDRDHDWDHDPYATLYERCVGLLRYLGDPEMPPWATHYFAYDHLTLVNRDAYLAAGAWDTHIPYYAADCDMYLRLHWNGYWQPSSEAGLIYDVDVALDDIAALFRIPGSHARFQGDPVFGGDDVDGGATTTTVEGDVPHRPSREIELQREQELDPWVDRQGETFAHLVEVAERMQALKWSSSSSAGGGSDGVRRNTWQTRQAGGEGEPFYRDPAGFTAGIDALTDAGRRVFADKWGHRGCDLLNLGIEGEDAWRLERDWDTETEDGDQGGSWGKDWSLGG